MDNLTHTIAGAVIGKAVRAELHEERAVFWAALIGANISDIDVLARLWGSMNGLKYHRGITHSFAGGLILALLLAVPIWRWGRCKRFGPLLLAAYLGVLSHILLDGIGSFGLQLFAPFSFQRMSLDLVSIVDPYVTGLFILTLILCRRRKELAPRMAAVGGGVFAVYLALMLVFQQTALGRGLDRAAEAGIGGIRQAAALPNRFSPLSWTVLIEDGRGVHRTTVRIGQLPSDFREFSKGEESRFSQAAALHPDVQAFLRFARFPMVRELELGGRHVLEYADLLFTRGNPRPFFFLRVTLDDSARVVSIEVPPPFLLNVLRNPITFLRG